MMQNYIDILRQLNYELVRNWVYSNIVRAYHSVSGISSII